jgi:hypothetical protein
MSNLNVFVVQRETDGIWDAACCDQRCGFGMHGVAEETTKAAAERAATAHRKELAATPVHDDVPAARCPTCGQRKPKGT